MIDRAREGTDFIEAPFSSEQVDALNRYQRLGYVHEFTCPEHHGGADRTLYATKDGWRCPHCGYQQDWAHRAMLDATPIEKLIKLSCDVYLPPNTIIRKGCDLSVLMNAMNERGSWSAEQCRFNDPAATIKELFTPPSPEPMMQPSQLRDLILQLDRVVQAHPAYSQAADAMRHLRDHLQALAFCEETNRRDAAGAPAPVYKR